MPAPQPLDLASLGQLLNTPIPGFPHLINGSNNKKSGLLDFLEGSVENTLLRKHERYYSEVAS